MHRIALGAALAFVLIGTAFVVIAGTAAAQSLDEPLHDKLGQKLDGAQADPAGFAQAQATETQLAHDANWTIAYACFVAHEAEDETGAELPEVDQCANFEEALGIAEEAIADEEEEIVADAEELEEDAVAEAEALAADSLATTDQIVDDPGNALDTLAAFLDRTLRAVQRLIDGITVGLGASAALLGDALDILGKGCAIAVVAPFAGAYQLGGLLWGAGATGAAVIADGVLATVDGIAAAVTATTDGIASGAGATWGAITDAAGAVQDALGGLFGANATPSTPDQPTLPDKTRPVTDTTDGLLDTATGMLDR